MQWSRLKARVEGFFAPAVAGRVELRFTRYRRAHDQTGRGYISVDGQELWNMCTLQYWPQEYRRRSAILASDDPALARAIDHRQQYLIRELALSPSVYGTESMRAMVAGARAREELIEEGIMDQWSFYRTLERYCNSCINVNLSSKEALVRALAMLDARLGKRRMAVMDVTREHPMVQFFYAFRSRAEKSVHNPVHKGSHQKRRAP